MTTSLSSHKDARRALEIGIKRLGVGFQSIHGNLPCREKHVELIQAFIQNSEQVVLQLFGMPGTGKTAAVHYALELVSANLPLTSIFINGYLVEKIWDIYSMILSHLSLTRMGAVVEVSRQHAAGVLEQRFRTGWSGNSTSSFTPSPSTPCVVVLDEVDRIIQRHPKVFMKLMDWLSLPYANFQIITIANRMDVGADGKTRSRFDTSAKVVFQPYSMEDLKMILLDRTRDIFPPLLTERAIMFICQQAASHCGDVRRMLQSTSSAVCKVLLEWDTKDPANSGCENGIVDIRDAHAVMRQVYHDRLFDFFNDIRDPVMFLTLAILALETRRLTHVMEEQSKLTIDIRVPYEHLFFQLTEFITSNRSLSLLNSVILHEVDLLEILRIFRRMTFVEISFGEEETPLGDARFVLKSMESVFITLLQPFQSILDLCRLKEEFFEILSILPKV